MHKYIYKSICIYIKLNLNFTLMSPILIYYQWIILAVSRCLSVMSHSNSEKPGSYFLPSIYLIVQFQYIRIVVSVCKLLLKKVEANYSFLSALTDCP